MHTEPKQGYFLFMKARNEELCQDRCTAVLCKLPMCSCEGTGVQPTLFQPQAFGEEAGNQVLAGLALSLLFLSCVFMACLSGEWKAFLCIPIASSRASTFPAGALLVCLFAVIIYSFTYLGGRSCQWAHWICTLQAETAATASMPNPHRHAGHPEGEARRPMSGPSGRRLFQGSGGTCQTWTCLLARQAWSAAGFWQRSCISQQLSFCVSALYHSPGQWGGPRHPDVSPGSLSGPTWTASGMINHSCSPWGCATGVSTASNTFLQRLVPTPSPWNPTEPSAPAASTGGRQ